MDINLYYLKRYEGFVGTSPLYEREYTESQFIEIMSRSLAFWRLEHIEPYPNMDEELMIRSTFVTDMFIDTLEYVAYMFNDEHKEKILDRTKILGDRVRNDNIQKIIDKIKIISNISHKLHLNAKKYSEKIDTKCILLDPDSWLANQSTMRDSYEMYLDKISELDHSMKSTLLNNDFIKYIKFMYDNYPIGYGYEMSIRYNNNRFCDSSEIYYEKKYF